MKSPTVREKGDSEPTPGLEERLTDSLKAIDGAKRHLVLSYIAYLLLILAYAYLHLR